jgi:hypothetical protein
MCPICKWLWKMRNVDITIHSNKAVKLVHDYCIRKFYSSFIFQEAELWRTRYRHFIMFCVCVLVGVRVRVCVGVRVRVSTCVRAYSTWQVQCSLNDAVSRTNHTVLHLETDGEILIWNVDVWWLNSWMGSINITYKIN